MADRKPAGEAAPGPDGDAPASSLPVEHLDADAVKVVRRLVRAGHQAYLVGGCVRDLYLGIVPKDFDVATSATPEETRKIFRNSRVIGRRFKIVHVYFGSKVIETATFRRPPPTTGSADDPLITHDNEWGSIEDDARRRDFTINGLFYDVETGEIVDFVDGIEDLEERVIRTIGDPRVRFQEDPVRMIRAIKFAARLGFHMEDATWGALLETAPDIEKCSQARVLEEIYKLLRGGASRRSFELMLASPVFRHLMPVFLELFSSGSDEGLLPPDKAPEDSKSALLWRYLDALDDYHRQTGHVAVNGVLLATLFAPVVGERLVDGSRRDLDAALDEAMGAVGAARGVARRDREMARQILMAQHRMLAPDKRRRASLVSRQYFHDALIFLGITIKARGVEGSELARWKQLAEAHGPPRRRSPTDPRDRPRDDNEGGRKRRRRRGGKRRSGGGDRGRAS